jgi:tetratricopeptide (TPR) repeat protein
MGLRDDPAGDKRAGMHEFFISYRREIGGGHAGRLFDALERRIGRERVFMDTTGIEPGTSFPQALRQALARCRVVMVIIAPGWADVTSERGRRLAQDDDWVRIEIETALDARVRVIPVLVGEARMPRAAELPPSLQPLVEFQAVDLRSASWDDDVRRLVRALGVPALRRHWIAVGTATMGLAGVMAVAMWWMPRPAPTVLEQAAPRPAGERRSGSVYDMRLASSTPSQAEQEGLAQRFAAQGLSVPLLRRFLAIISAESAPPSSLDTALQQYVGLVQELQHRSLYDDAGVAGSSPDCDRGQKLIRTVQFDEASAAFARGAQLPAKPDADARARAAWCLWLDGQLQAMQRRAQAAQEQFSRASGLLKAAGRDGQRLQVGVLHSAAKVADAFGDRALALARIEEAVAAARVYGQENPLRLALLDAAEWLDRAGRPEEALRRREEALSVMERSGRPGSEERKLAQIIVAAYDRAGRRDEAGALRQRYGLALAK